MHLFRKALRAFTALPRRSKLLWCGVFAVFLFTVYQSWTVFSRIGRTRFEQSLVSDLVVNEAGHATKSTSVVVAEELGEPVPGTRAGHPRISVDEEAPLLPQPEQPVRTKPTLGLTQIIVPAAVKEVVEPSWRRDDNTSYWYYDSATKFHVPGGSPVVAAAPGVVTATTPATGGGWDVTIRHVGEWEAIYGNVFQLAVAPDSAVSGHTVIGTAQRVNRIDPASDVAEVALTVYHNGELVPVLPLLNSDVWSVSN